MSFEAPTQKNGRAVQKQRSSQEATRRFRPSAHQSHPAVIIQRAQLNPGSLTRQDVLYLHSTIGNRAVAQLLSQAPRNVDPADSCPVAQKQPAERLYGLPVQRQGVPEEEELQMKSNPAVLQQQEMEEDEELLQGKFATSETPTQFKGERRQQENRTGMSDNLKAGIENLSGMSMDDVKVHYNSSQPAQLNALAYARGQDIHLGPGQERHLPHEGWHAVQQMQGRVMPTMQAKGGVLINDDAGLEHEADVIGAKALQMRRSQKSAFESPIHAMAPIKPRQGSRHRQVQRPAALLTVQLAQVTLGANGHNNVVDSDALSAGDLATHLADATLPAATRRVLARRERRLATGDRPANHNATTVATFTTVFDAHMAAYPNVRLPDGIGPKVSDLLAVLGAQGVPTYSLEYYTGPVFSMGPLAAELGFLNALLAPGVKAPVDIDRARKLTADILLSCTLIASIEGRRKFFGDFSSSHFSRYAIEVLSPLKAVDAIQALRIQLNAGPSDNVYEAVSLGNIGLDDNDDMAQRFLKLSLLNTKNVIRAALAHDPLFNDIMGSGRVAQFMITSSGADEQYFLNSCALTARNVDMASHAATLAVLLAAGRRFAIGLRDEVAANGPAADVKWTRIQTIGQLVTHRVNDALEEFMAIEMAASNMIQKTNWDSTALKKLKRRWSRTMQKLGTVVNWQQPQQLSQVSKKYIKDRWTTSAVLAVGTGLTYGVLHGRTRTARRILPPDSNTYEQRTDTSIGKTTDLQHRLVATMLGPGHITAAQMWTNLYRIGGTTISQPGHGLYVKAVIRNRVKIFAVNDVLQRTWNYYTITEWPGFVGRRRHEVSGPPELETG